MNETESKRLYWRGEFYRSEKLRNELQAENAGLHTISQTTRRLKMGIEHGQRFCNYCNDYVLAIRNTPNHILHLLLTIITGGLWIIVWIFIGKSSWRCSICGSSSTKMFTTKSQDMIGRSNNHNHNTSNINRRGSYSIIRPIALSIFAIISTVMLAGIIIIDTTSNNTNVDLKSYAIIGLITFAFWCITFISFVVWHNNRA